MANDKIAITYELVGDDIHKRQGESDKVVAKYIASTKTLTFPNSATQRWNSDGVNAFLATNELLVQNILRDDLPKDPPTTKAIPPRPKKGADGDKTVEVVDWYYQYKPNQFKARYKVIGTYTGKVRLIESIYIARPGDGILEYRGERKIEKQVNNVILAERKTHLTYTPSECIEWHEDDDQDMVNDTEVEEAAT